MSGGRVALVHAYLYFDGTALMVAAAQTEMATTVNGSEVTTDWFPVPEGAEVRLGGVMLRAGAPHVVEESATYANQDAGGEAWDAPPQPIDEARTAFFDPRTARPIEKEKKKKKPARPESPMRAPETSEATRFLPIEQMRRPPDGRDSVPRPSGDLASGQAPMSGPVPQASVSQGPPPAAASYGETFAPDSERSDVADHEPRAARAHACAGPTCCATCAARQPSGAERDPQGMA